VQVLRAAAALPAPRLLHSRHTALLRFTMQRFDAIVRPGHLAAVGLGPPLLLLLLVPGWANGWRGGEITPLEIAALTAFAQLAPIAALAWVLCSVAAYSVGPGRLVVHRVLWDRVHPLPGHSAALAAHRGIIRLECGGRICRVRPVNAPACLAALREACGATSAPQPAPTRAVSEER
jgi:hypothetical protein